MKNWIKIFFYTIGLFSLLLILNGCDKSSNDDTSKPVQVTEQEAQEQMVKTLFTGVSNNLENFDSLLLGEDGAITSITSNQQIASLLGEQTITDLQQASSITDLMDIQSLMQDAGIDSDSELQGLLPAENVTAEQYAAQIAQLMETFFNDPIRVGNTITYTLKADVICADAGSTEDIAACGALLSKLSLQQNLDSETSGTVSLLVDSAKPVTIGYSATQVYVEVDLAGLKSAIGIIELLTATEGDEPTQLPETFTGAARITLSAPTSTEVSITLGVTQAIHVAGLMEGDTIDISIAQSPNMLVFSQTETSTEMKMGMGAVSITIEDSSAAEGDPVWTQISMGGLSLNLSMTETDIIITNTNITDSLSIKLGQTQESLTEIANITLDNFGATISSEDMSLKFDTAFELVASITDPTGMFTDLLSGIDLSTPATLMVTADKDTEITLLGSLLDENSVPKIVTGNLSITGTGALVGSVSAGANQCLGAPTTEGATFFLEVIECPATP